MGANVITLLMSLATSFLEAIMPLFLKAFNGLLMEESTPVSGIYDTPNNLFILVLIFMAMGIGYTIIGWVFGFVSSRLKIGKKSRRKTKRA